MGFNRYLLFGAHPSGILFAIEGWWLVGAPAMWP